MKPIIFIPGIQATSLVNSNSYDFNYIWNAYDTLGSSISTSILGAYLEETLQVNPIFDAGSETIIERGHIARLPYEASLTNLKRKLNGNPAYKDTPIYLFGYDWRMSNMENAKKLLLFVEYLKEKLNKNRNPDSGEIDCPQVEGFRFITHSMGGLVMSCYLKLLEGSGYGNIDKIIMNAPPFLGSPYALVHMVKGDGGFRSILNWAIGRNEDMRKVIRTYPGVYELLPVYKDALTYDDDNSQLSLLEKKYWQSNVYSKISALFDERIHSLQQFRNGGMADLSKLPGELRDRIVIVVGEDAKKSTYTKVKVTRRHKDLDKFIDLDKLKDGKASGDGTVPFVSSSVYSESIKTLAVRKENFFEESSNSLDFHGLFLKDSRVQNIMQRYFLTDDANPVVPGLQSWWETPNDSVRRV